MAPKISSLYPCFLGPLSENGDLLESLVVEYLRDHIYWRRNFHPNDKTAVPPGARYDPEVQATIAKMRASLHRLSARLKSSVPFFSPRYVGHMASDPLMPGLVAHLVTTVYNPNNVAADASGESVDMELEVGEHLATMFGFNVGESDGPRAWGHITSGGTVANYEGLWNLRAARLLGPAVRQAALELGLNVELDFLSSALADCDTWRLLNLSVDQALALRRAFLEASDRGCGRRVALKALKVARVEYLGLADFLGDYGAKSPVVLAPVSAHYSWAKSMKILGFGERNLRLVPTDAHMRLDPTALEEMLEACLDERRPVLAVVGVLGTTEFGTLDPIHAIVELREAYRDKGLDFGIHVDAAWGGYLSALFREEDGGFAAHDAVRRDFSHFPSEEVYRAFAALPQVDSVTVDPHKLGFTPYPAGAFVARNREVTTLLAQDAPYVFDVTTDTSAELDVELRHLGRYVMEGSKAGSAAAAAWVTYDVLPLHRQGFGKLVGQTIRNSEYLYDKISYMQQALQGYATLTVPFDPDTNIICLLINPKGNTSLAGMNACGRAVFEEMRFSPLQPLQTRHFIGSFTSLLHAQLRPHLAEVVLTRAGVDPATFVAEPKTAEASNHIFVLRHTLMNPWLLANEEHTVLDEFLEFLINKVKAHCGGRKG